MQNKMFTNVLIVGLGLMGSSLARALKDNNLAEQVAGFDVSSNVKKKCEDLKIVDFFIDSLESDCNNFDLIIICSPLGTYKEIFSILNKNINKKCILTDIGSTKVSAIKDFKNLCHNQFISFVPGHPITGLEKSGPEYGFAELFVNRYCILTPFEKNESEIKIISMMWQKLGMLIEYMDSNHHDRVLAITSHVPQLIAYSIVSSTTELDEKMKNEIIKFSASGFRDFTRLAGSDPIMWRDVYLLNKNAVLEMLGRFTEDLTAIQKAIRNDDSTLLEKIFTSTRNIRKLIENAGQAGTFDPRESKDTKK